MLKKSELQPLIIGEVEILKGPLIDAAVDGFHDQFQTATCESIGISLPEGSNVKLIDPSKIVQSKFANRHELNFRADNFDKFIREIASTNGNIQPIKVRPIDNQKYEIVFGHRRHRACLYLNLPVSAIIEEISDQDLWMHMDRENRERKNPSMYEQGVLYKLALKEGIFPSIRQLASAAGISGGYVSRCIQVANLPDEIINAFDTPMAINSPMIITIEAALAKDYGAVLSRARTAKDNHMTTTNQVLNWLVGQDSTKRVIPLQKNNKKFATITIKNGTVTVASKHLNLEKVIEWLEALDINP